MPVIPHAPLCPELSPGPLAPRWILWADDTLRLAQEVLLPGALLARRDHNVMIGKVSQPLQGLALLWQLDLSDGLVIP